MPYYAFSSLSDQFGRKPVIVVGLTGIVVFVIAFGFSRSFAWALITRALAGTLAGNGMLINNAVADMTDESNQAQAYAIIGLTLNVASVIGPFIGCVMFFFVTRSRCIEFMLFTVAPSQILTIPFRARW